LELLEGQQRLSYGAEPITPSPSMMVFQVSWQG